MMRIILIVSGAILCLIAVLAIAIYGFGLDNSATRTFNRVLPFLPASMVNGEFVSLSKVEERLEMYERAVKYQSKNPAIDRPQARSEILGKLIEHQIIVDLLKKNQIDLSNPGIEQFSRYVGRNFQTDRNKVFGVSEAEFRKQFISADYQSKSLQAWLYAKATASSEFRRAARVQDLLNSGLEFVEAAKKYSEDPDSKYLGGDLGLFSMDEINLWLKDAAFALSASSTSAVIVSPDGYHILQVSNRDPGPPEKIELHHILIRGFDFEEYLAKQRKNYRIYLFLRV